MHVPPGQPVNSECMALHRSLARYQGLLLQRCRDSHRAAGGEQTRGMNPARAQILLDTSYIPLGSKAFVWLRPQPGRAKGHGCTPRQLIPGAGRRRAGRRRVPTVADCCRQAVWLLTAHTAGTPLGSAGRRLGKSRGLPLSRLLTSWPADRWPMG